MRTFLTKFFTSRKNDEELPPLSYVKSTDDAGQPATSGPSALLQSTQGPPHSLSSGPANGEAAILTIDHQNAPLILPTQTGSNNNQYIPNPINDLPSISTNNYIDPVAQPNGFYSISLNTAQDTQTSSVITIPNPPKSYLDRLTIFYLFQWKDDSVERNTHHFKILEEIIEAHKADTRNTQTPRNPTSIKIKPNDQAQMDDPPLDLILSKLFSSNAKDKNKDRINFLRYLVGCTLKGDKDILNKAKRVLSILDGMMFRIFQNRCSEELDLVLMTSYNNFYTNKDSKSKDLTQILKELRLKGEDQGKEIASILEDTFNEFYKILGNILNKRPGKSLEESLNKVNEFTKNYQYFSNLLEGLIAGENSIESKSQTQALAGLNLIQKQRICIYASLVYENTLVRVGKMFLTEEDKKGIPHSILEIFIINGKFIEQAFERLESVDGDYYDNNKKKILTKEGKFRANQSILLDGSISFRFAEKIVETYETNIQERVIETTEDRNKIPAPLINEEGVSLKPLDVENKLIGEDTELDEHEVTVATATIKVDATAAGSSLEAGDGAITTPTKKTEDGNNATEDTSNSTSNIVISTTTKDLVTPASTEDEELKTIAAGSSLEAGDGAKSTPAKKMEDGNNATEDTSNSTSNIVISTTTKDLVTPASTEDEELKTIAAGSSLEAGDGAKSTPAKKMEDGNNATEDTSNSTSTAPSSTTTDVLVAPPATEELETIAPATEQVNATAAESSHKAGDGAIAPSTKNVEETGDGAGNNDTKDTSNSTSTVVISTTTDVLVAPPATIKVDTTAAESSHKAGDGAIAPSTKNVEETGDGAKNFATKGTSNSTSTVVISTTTDVLVAPPATIKVDTTAPATEGEELKTIAAADAIATSDAKKTYSKSQIFGICFFTLAGITFAAAEAIAATRAIDLSFISPQLNEPKNLETIGLYAGLALMIVICTIITGYICKHPSVPSNKVELDVSQRAKDTNNPVLGA